MRLLTCLFFVVCNGVFAAFPTISCDSEASVVVIEEGIDSIFVDILGRATADSLLSKLTKKTDAQAYQFRISLPKVQDDHLTFALSDEEPLLFSTLSLPLFLQGTWSLAPSPLDQVVKFHSFRFRSQQAKTETLDDRGAVVRNDWVRFGLTFSFPEEPARILTADLDFAPGVCRTGERAWSPAR